MAELQEVVASLGHTEVVTYIQSGNVLFTPRPAGSATAARTDTAALAAKLERAIAERAGVRARAVVRPARIWPAACATTRIRVRRTRGCCTRCSCPRHPGPTSARVAGTARNWATVSRLAELCGP